jgi:hypothetical protein
MGGQRERVRGEYMFSSLMKQKIKGKNCAVFASPEKEKCYLFIYEVITWEFFYKRSANHYSRAHTHTHYLSSARLAGRHDRKSQSGHICATLGQRLFYDDGKVSQILGRHCCSAGPHVPRQASGGWAAVVIFRSDKGDFVGRNNGPRPSCLKLGQSDPNR